MHNNGTDEVASATGCLQVPVSKILNPDLSKTLHPPSTTVFPGVNIVSAQWVVPDTDSNVPFQGNLMSSSNAFIPKASDCPFSIFLKDYMLCSPSLSFSHSFSAQGKWPSRGLFRDFCLPKDLFFLVRSRPPVYIKCHVLTSVVNWCYLNKSWHDLNR